MIGKISSFLKSIFSKVPLSDGLDELPVIGGKSLGLVSDNTSKPLPSNTELILNELGYDYTKTGIKKFQSDFGLKSDGIAGNKTIAALEKLVIEKPESLGELRRCRLTHYYVASESEFSNKERVPVYDDNKKLLLHVPAAFFASMALEGTGKLRDGKLLNVTGGNYVSVDSEEYEPMNRWYKSHVASMAKKGRDPRPPGYFGIRFKNEKISSVQPFHEVKNLGKGWGVIRKIDMDPFFTCATDIGAYASSDPRFKGKGGLIPPGTKVFILELKGKLLPDGRIHDGWCTAHDTGGGIFGSHIDLFSGTRTDANNSPVKKSIVHIWFEGIEDRIDRNYEKGLYDK